MMKAITSMTCRRASLFAAVVFVGLTGFTEDPREPEKCPFRFRAIPARDFADCSLMVQFDNVDRAELDFLLFFFNNNLSSVFIHLFIYYLIFF